MSAGTRYREWRTKRGLHWEMVDDVTGHGEEVIRTSCGFHPDEYAALTEEEAQDYFAKTFVMIRTILEQSHELCMDDEEDRLNLCQKLARWATVKSQ